MLVKKHQKIGYDEIIPGKMLNISFAENIDGQMSDINIFSNFFDENEQQEWTTCKNARKGDILSWDQESVSKIKIIKANDTNKFAEITTVDEEDFCSDSVSKNRNGVIEIFNPKSLSHSEAGLVCKRLNGVFVLLPETAEDLDILTREMQKYQKLANITFDFWGNIAWVGGTAKREEEHLVKDFYPSEGYDWYDPISGRDLVLDESVKAKMWLDPHSYSYLPDICPALWDNPDFSFWAHQCKRKLLMGTVCKFEKPLSLKISGLCKSSPLDLDYNLAIPSPDPNGQFRRRLYAGPTGWKIVYSTEKETWTIVNQRQPNKNLTLVSVGEVLVPTGKHTWRMANNTCNNGVTNEAELLVSACLPNQFTCDDGACISMLSRCNNFQDCEDVSDEKNCMLVYKDAEKYLKDKTPPVLNGTEKLPVVLNIDVTEIISIKEVDQIINIQFELGMSWFDGRLKFYNLKENQKMNTLTFDELFEIWVPQILFKNTQHQLKSQKDEDSFAFVMRKSSGSMSGEEMSENIEIYNGAQNPINFFRVYAIDF